MSCNCTEYSCLEIAPQIFQCGDDLTTTLLANQTGIWLMRFEFNGKWFGREISVTNNEVIEIPNVFNESYNHTIEFYNTSGTLFNDTCYMLDTSKVVIDTTSSSPHTSGSQGSYMTVEVTEDGDDVTVPAGRTVWLIFMGNQAWLRDVDFTQSGTTITINNGSTLTDGQTLLMMYL